MNLFRTLLYFFTVILVASGAYAAGEVNVYSSQKEHLIRPILDKFEQQHNIKVNLKTGGKSELVSRLAMEGKNTPADLLLTVDIGNIYDAKTKQLLQPIQSEILNNIIPDNLRSPDGDWYGITLRSRAIFYRKDVVQPGEISTYEELADPKWQGKLLIRSSSNVYNQSLVAYMLAKHGEEKTLAWVKGIVANLARDPKGGDSDQLRALAAGEGAIAVANTYYFGRLISDDPAINDANVKNKVAIVLPNQQQDGAHVNIRGGGVTKFAKNKDNAIKLLEFLVGQEAQQFFVGQNLEYPVRSDITPDTIIAQWGEIKNDPTSLESIGRLHKAAIEIMDKAGWK